jgi:UDP-2-acetamido-2,6-beta-L-arabino-hexul-4-ose reductase
VKVLVTGARGFISKNLCTVLENMEDIELLKYSHDDDPDRLRNIAGDVGFVFHLAGVNRPKDEKEFDEGNLGFTETLLGILENAGNTPGFVFASTIQAKLDNPYGKSKKDAEDAVFSWAKRTGAKAVVYRLPNVFGKWCRPNYNSVVATWCHAVAHGKPLRIDDPEKELTLVYIDDVVQEFLNALKDVPAIDDEGYGTVERKYQVKLQYIADALLSFRDSRQNLVLPDFSDDFTRALYGTYLSYLPEEEFSYKLGTRSDDRGWLAEFIKSPAIGQIFVSTTKPGITRGNHWHHTKTEKFLVVKGEATIKFRKIGDERVLEYRVSGDRPEVVDIPTGYTHSITNTGTGELVTLFWANEILNPEKPDTYYSEVEKDES